MPTIQVRSDIALGIQAEARRLGIPEEEVVERAWAELVYSRRHELRVGLLKRPWLLFTPAGLGILVGTFKPAVT